MKAALAIAGCLLIAIAPTAATTSAPRGEDFLIAATLQSHNGARQSHGLAPIAWDETLAAGAMEHAQYMAATGYYGHDQTPGRRKKQGENIWRGPRGQFDYHVILGTMTAERRYFRPGTFPWVSSSGNWHDVGHYTQIIWPSTTHVGCALASSQTTDYFVCRYSPTGNKDGVNLS